MYRLHCKKKIKGKRVYTFLLNYFKQKCPTTYSDNNSIQCGPNKGRSFEDLVALVKNYFPRATKKQIAFNLIKLILKYPRYKNDIKQDFYIGSIDCPYLGAASFHNSRYYYFYPTEYTYSKDSHDDSWNRGSDYSSFKVVYELAKEYEKRKKL